MSEGRGQSRALAYLFILNFTFIVVGYVLFAHYVNATIRAQQEQAQFFATRAARGKVVTIRRCWWNAVYRLMPNQHKSTMHRLAALQPSLGVGTRRLTRHGSL